MNVEKIHAALCKARTTIGWYAFGDAVRLAGEISKICTAYEENKEDKGVHRQMVEVAERTQSFLSSNKGSPNRSESYKELSQAILDERLGQI